MTLLEFLVLLVVAGICGSVGQAIAGRSKSGCIVSIAVGFIGAIFGRWMAGTLGLPEFFVVDVGGQPFPIIWTIIGSTLFVAVIAMVAGKRA
ncbi:MAG: hypothetical protein R3F34_04130 [Planctomycetota bacterium]